MRNFLKHIYSHQVSKCHQRQIRVLSFLKDGILEFLSEALIVSILTLSLNENYVHYQNMILTKMVRTDFN